MINTNRRKINIILSLAISYTLSLGLTHTVFIANSSAINPSFIASIRNLPATLINAPGQFMAYLNLPAKPTNNTIVNEPSPQPLKNFVSQVKPPTDVVFKSFSKGVQAADDIKTNTKYFKISAGTKVEVRKFKIKLDGVEKEVDVIIPSN